MGTTEVPTSSPGFSRPARAATVMASWLSGSCENHTDLSATGFRLLSAWELARTV